jgi:hypothetical protein
MMQMCKLAHSLPLLVLLVALSAGSSIAQEASRQKLTDVIDALMSGKVVKCHLVIKGSTNLTEVALRGASITHAHLSCTGSVLRIAVHPIMLPFVGSFKGVALVNGTANQKQQGRPPEGQQEGSTTVQPGELATAEPSCRADSSTLISLCGTVAQADVVIFEQMHVSDILTPLSLQAAMGPGQLGRLGPGTTSTGSNSAAIAVSATNSHVHIEDPTFIHVATIGLGSRAHGVTVKRGLFRQTRGVLTAGMVAFQGTQFRNN